MRIAKSAVSTRCAAIWTRSKAKCGEQLEIEFLPTPIEDAGDYLVLARWLIRNVAYRHGCLATFAPKIEEGVAGNGFHVHMEVRRERA